MAVVQASNIMRARGRVPREYGRAAAALALIALLALPAGAGPTLAPASATPAPAASTPVPAGATVTLTLTAPTPTPAPAAGTAAASAAATPATPAASGSTITLTITASPAPTAAAAAAAASAAPSTRTISLSPEKLDALLAKLRGELKGFDFRRTERAVTMFGSAAHLAIAETVLMQAQSLDFDVTDISVADKDPDSVDKVKDFLVQALPSTGRWPVVLLHDGNSLLIWGSAADRTWVQEKVRLLATAKADAELQFALVPALTNDDPIALDGIRTMVVQASTSAPDRTPLTILREGEAFWICGSKANCDWAQAQIATLLKQTARLRFEVIDVSDRSGASVNMVVELIKTLATASGRTSLTVLPHDNRLLLWGSEDDCAWAKQQLGAFAEPNHLQRTDVFWLRGTVDPREVENYLNRGRWPGDSWAINGRRIEITRQTPIRKEILDALWERHYLYTRAFRSLAMDGTLDPQEVKECKLPDTPDRDWQWDFDNNSLLVTARPEDSVYDYSRMIWKSGPGEETGTAKYAYDFVFNYPSDEIDDNDCPSPEAQTVRLYFARDPWQVVRLLNEAAGLCGASDVRASADMAAGALPGIVLVGPRLQIRNLKRVLEGIDVQHPGVQLEVWACQLSGSDAGQVARNARAAQRRVECTGRLVRGYVHVLTQYATFLEQTNYQRRGAVRVGTGGWRSDAFAYLVPYAPHVPSLTEMLLAQMLVVPSEIITGPSADGQPADDLSVARRQLGEDLRNRLSDWVTSLRTADPEALQDWQEGLALPTGAESTARTAQVSALLDKVADAKGRRPRPELVDSLLPQRFLAMMATTEDVSDVQSVLSRYLVSKNYSDPDPDQSVALRADAQALLQGAEQSLADDIREVFLDPLEQNVRKIIGADNPNGLGSVSKTSVSVISESQASVTGAASTYFKGLQQPAISPDLLSHLLGGGGGGGYSSGGAAGTGSYPATAGAPTAAATAAPTATVTGTPSAATLGAGAGATAEASGGSYTGASGGSSGASGGGSGSGGGGGLGLAGLLAGGPASTGELVALGLALADQPRVWASMDEGTTLTFTPHVLQGGSGAELNIDFDVKHQAPADVATGNVEALSRVADHHAVTTVDLQPLDLFSLSSFGMETSTGARTDAIPVLGYIPLLGSLFRYHAPAAHVHHESLLVVYSTVLPTDNDWKGRLGFYPIGSTGSPNATWFNWQNGMWKAQPAPAAAAK